MGKVKPLWEAERNERWQQHFDDWCFNNIGGREPVGSEVTEAEQYAEDMLDEEDDDDV